MNQDGLCEILLWNGVLILGTLCVYKDKAVIMKVVLFLCIAQLLKKLEKNILSEKGKQVPFSRLYHKWHVIKKTQHLGAGVYYTQLCQTW